MSGRSDWMTLTLRVPRRLIEDVDGWVGEDLRTDFATRAIEAQLRQERGKTDVPPIAEQCLAQGRDALKEGDRRAARRFFTQAIRLCPTFSDAYHELGAMEYASRRYERAMALFEKAAESAVDPKMARVRSNWWLEISTRPYMRAKYYLALTMHRLGKNEEAKSSFIELLRLDPLDHQGARFLLADVLRSLGEEIPEDVDKLIDLALGDDTPEATDWSNEREEGNADDQGGGLIH